jgi:hypothetical protein
MILLTERLAQSVVTRMAVRIMMMAASTSWSKEEEEVEGKYHQENRLIFSDLGLLELDQHLAQQHQLYLVFN